MEMNVTVKTITRSVRVHICEDVYVSCNIVASVYNDEVIVVTSHIKCDSDTMKVITDN